MTDSRGHGLKVSRAPRRYHVVFSDCPMCRAPLVAIELPSAGARLHSCNRCDARWWADDAGIRPFAKVLGALGGKSA